MVVAVVSVLRKAMVPLRGVATRTASLLLEESLHTHTHTHTNTRRQTGLRHNQAMHRTLSGVRGGVRVPRLCALSFLTSGCAAALPFTRGGGGMRFAV